MRELFVHAGVVCVLLLGGFSSGWAYYNLDAALGTNTNEVSETDSSVPFVDLFHAALPFEDARPWLTKGEVQYDADGWPVDLRGGQAGTRFLANLPANTVPDGAYTVLFEGDGDMTYANDAKLITHAQGKDTIQIGAGADAMLNATLLITRTNPQNPLRNIRILPPGGICEDDPFKRVTGEGDCAAGSYRAFSEYYAKILFNPDYLHFMKDFKVIRFMNMGGITQNPLQTWEQRPRLTQATWGGKEGQRGAPLEIMVELANRLNAHPWLVIPHAADDDFVTQYARYVRQHLNPDLKPHLEYSNETWNTLFLQGNYVREQGVQRGLDSNADRAGYRYYSERSVEIFKLWENVFGGKQRLVRILSGWTINPDLTQLILTHRDAYRHADAFAIGPYFFGGHEEIRRVKTVDDVFQLLTDPQYRYSLRKVLDYISEQKALADKYKVALIAYEGGQGLVDFKTSDNNAHPNPLLYAANRDSRMAALYGEFLTGWKTAGGQLFMHYSSPRTYQKYGTWGTKEYITQATEDAPKYQAILAFMRTNPCWWAGCSTDTFMSYTDFWKR
ncbi:hypothetical protein [Thiothrix unzii]|uniref:hypothetical protein n=1 Tax=Thiothrix unzii TaxID=111769 RepID=UPI002A36C6BD|nr:hypothetical protein [Thiothrix unzii]MDX9989498.1 hypothetical protein [Thiothrix unzii]